MNTPTGQEGAIQTNTSRLSCPKERQAALAPWRAADAARFVLHGRVHSECAHVQVLLKHYASGNCKRMRAVPFNALFDMMTDLN